MIITIKLPNASDSSSRIALPGQLAQISDEEVVLVELQGTLEVDGGERDGQTVGLLRMDGKPTLVIGHHLLEGTITSLAKPLAVLRRRCEQDETEWVIVAVVRRKILFAKRPMPVVSRSVQGMA